MFEKCEIAAHIWVLVKWRTTNPYKFACSTLRVEGPAVRKCGTKHLNAVRTNGKLTKLNTLKGETYRELVESLIGGKAKTGIAKGGNKTRKDTPTVATCHTSASFRVIVSFLASCVREELKGPIPQFLSACFSLNTLIQHRYHSSKHGKRSRNKTCHTKATQDNRRANLRTQYCNPVSDDRRYRRIPDK